MPAIDPHANPRFRRRPCFFAASPAPQPAPADICETVRLLTLEFLSFACERIGERRERRRMACHVRQIAMYVCHVTLQMTLTAIGDGFGRDRSTVAHACAVVEDRRDDKDFDEFVAAIERIATLAFGRLGGSADA
jgi:hypothetical protein